MVTEIEYVTQLVIKSIYKDAVGYGRAIQIRHDGQWFTLVIRSADKQNLEIVEAQQP